jgi:hypothetical protein
VRFVGLRKSSVSKIPVQSASERNFIGSPAQYRLEKYFWPEVEANYSYWPNGIHEGSNQLFITSDSVLGKLAIWKRVAVMFGAGCQFAVTEHPLYHRNIIVTSRIPF